MKKIIGIIVIGTVIITSCGKVNTYSNNFASAVFINASPGTPSTFAYIDTLSKHSSATAYRGNTGYLSIVPGSRGIQVKNSVSLVTNFVQVTENFMANTASTFLVYDTLTSPTGSLKMIRLNDTLSLPDAGFIKVRFLPLAINAPISDVTFLRTSVNPNDSVTITNRSYVGPAPNAAAITALSKFTSIPLGTYVVKIKSAGTQTVQFETGALNWTNIGGIFTVFSTGTAQNLPLNTGTFRHYP